MPFTVRKYNAQVRDSESGQMKSVGLLAGDETDALDNINNAKTAAVAAVELKGQTTLASIPADYTELSNEVDDVKNALDVVFSDVTYNSWVEKGISSSSGNLTTNSKRIASGFVTGEDYEKIHTINGYKFAVYQYTNAEGYEGTLQSDGTYVKSPAQLLWLNEFYIPNDGMKYRVAVRSDPEADIEESDGGNVKFAVVRSHIQDETVTEPMFTPALRLKAINDYITPEMFGAIGDGITDDTQAMQDCITYACNNHIKIKLRNAQYIINESLVISAPINMEGYINPRYGRLNSDIDSTVIAYRGSATEAVVKFDGDSPIYGGCIRNITIDARQLANYCLDLSNAHYIVVEGCMFVYSLISAIFIKKTYGNKIIRCVFDYNQGNCITLNSAANTTIISFNRLTLRNGANGIYIVGSNGVSVINNSIEGGYNGNYAIKISGENSKMNNISGNRIEFEYTTGEQTSGICIMIDTGVWGTYISGNAFFNQEHRTQNDMYEDIMNYILDNGIGTKCDLYMQDPINTNPYLKIENSELVGFYKHGLSFSFAEENNYTKIIQADATINYPTIYSAMDCRHIRGNSITVNSLVKCSDSADSATLVMTFYKGGTSFEFADLGTQIEQLRSQYIYKDKYNIYSVSGVVPDDADTVTFGFRMGNGVLTPAGDKVLNVVWLKVGYGLAIK